MSNEQTPDRASLIAMANAHLEAGQKQEAERLLLLALADAEQEWGDVDERLIPLLEVTAFASRSDDFRQPDARPVPYLLRALAIAEKRLPADHPQRASLLRKAGVALRFAGRVPEARDLLLRAISIAEQKGDTRTQAYIVGVLAQMLLRDTPQEALAYCREGVRLEAETDPNQITHFVALLTLGKCLLALRKPTDARNPLEQAREMLVRASRGAEHRWLREVEDLLQQARNANDTA